jgi:bacterial/archaeal transporter family-2 protein
VTDFTSALETGGVQQDRRSDGALALAAGVVLAMMIDRNSALARHSSPLVASWIAHGIGAAASLLFVMAWAIASRRVGGGLAAPSGRGPLWAYFGGIPGAMTVLLAAITVNGPLGLAGTLALMLVGQMIFGMIADGFGWLGMARRTFTRRDLIAATSVIAGSAMIILSRN